MGSLAGPERRFCIRRTTSRVRAEPANAEPRHAAATMASDAEPAAGELCGAAAARGCSPAPAAAAADAVAAAAEDAAADEAALSLSRSGWHVGRGSRDGHAESVSGSQALSAFAVAASDACRQRQRSREGSRSTLGLHDAEGGAALGEAALTLGVGDTR